jgi:hypothetical protein
MEKARSHASPQFWELLEYDLGMAICYHFFHDDKRSPFAQVWQMGMAI